MVIFGDTPPWAQTDIGALGAERSASRAGQIIGVGIALRFGDRGRLHAMRR